MELIFCGTGAIGLPSLKALLASSEFRVKAIVTQPDRPAGRDLKPLPSVIKTEALRHGLPVFQPPRIRSEESKAWLKEMAPDLMVVAAYGQILPVDVLSIPRKGCLNIHASLLPRHRGASPIQTAILAGDRSTGITIMWMDEGLDTGDMVLSEEILIGDEETAGELHDRLAELAPEVLLRALRQIQEGTCARVPQDSALATHCGKLRKNDGLLDWTRDASFLSRQIRAMTPWPGTMTYRDDTGEILKIHHAVEKPDAQGPAGSIIAIEPDGIIVAAGTGGLLLTELQLQGRKKLSALELLRGYNLPVGTLFTDKPVAGSAGGNGLGGSQSL